MQKLEDWPRTLDLDENGHRRNSVIALGSFATLLFHRHQAYANTDPTFTAAPPVHRCATPWRLAFK